MRPQATFSFFHSPHRSFLHVAPFSASILPPRPSFLLVPPSSSSLFLPRPALSISFRIRKWPFFIDLDESVTDGPTNQRTDQPTDGRTDKASYRDARTHLKRRESRSGKRKEVKKSDIRHFCLPHFWPSLLDGSRGIMI